MNVARRVEQKCLARQAVTPRAPDFLIILFERLRHVVVNHEAHIRLVNSHSECERGNHNLHLVADKFRLMVGTHLVGKPRVIIQHGIAEPVEFFGEFIDLPL